MTLFDAGARTMARAVAAAGAKLGGIKRIVLGHGHTDHRGSAPGARRAGPLPPRRGAGRRRQRRLSLLARGPAGLPPAAAPDPRLLHRYAWDGGPVKIAGTLAEGDEVAGFRVVHLPGHAPGQIGLWRESDRLALVSDCFYTLDMWGRDCAAARAGRDYNYDTEQARARSASWPSWSPRRRGRATPSRVTGDVRSQLERAADA